MANQLADAYVQCSQAFFDLCSASEEDICSLEDLNSEFDRLRLWADNAGAAHTGHAYRHSLDYRLREASFYRDQVLNLLEILKDHIVRAQQIVEGARVPFESSALEERGCSDQESLETLEDREADDSPWDPCSDSDSEDPSHSNRVPNESASTGVDKKNLTEMDKLTNSIRKTVNGLYRLPIRRPALMDRIKVHTDDETLDSRTIDMMEVRRKFPLANAEVTERLAKMMTRRRQLLRYRRRHDETFSLPAIKHSDSPGKSNTKSFTPQPASTTLSPQQSNIPKGSEAYSLPETGLATSVLASTATAMAIPPKPRGVSDQDSSYFKCPYCSIITPYDISEWAWGKHVLEDLTPYVCTFPDCQLSVHVFDSYEKWHLHEAKDHRIEFHCNEPTHEPYRDQLSFISHMRAQHHLSIDEASGSSQVLRLFRRPMATLDGTCNLCFQATDSVCTHVARHLEQLALVAIPRVDYDVDDKFGGSQSDIIQHSFDHHSQSSDATALEDYETKKPPTSDVAPLETVPASQETRTASITHGRIYWCPFCRVPPYKSNGNITNHIEENHEPQKHHRCLDCGRSWNTKLGRTRHVSRSNCSGKRFETTHHELKKNLYACGVCASVFDDFILRQEHLLNHQQSGAGKDSWTKDNVMLGLLSHSSIAERWNALVLQEYNDSINMNSRRQLRWNWSNPQTEEAVEALEHKRFDNQQNLDQLLGIVMSTLIPACKEQPQTADREAPQNPDTEMVDFSPFSEEDFINYLRQMETGA